MDRPATDTDLHDAAIALPSVFMTEQWQGSHVYKVGDPNRFKMFAILNPGRSELTVKLADADVAELLIEAGVARRNAHLPRGGWITLLTDRLGLEDLSERLRDSHAVTSATLPKGVREKFGID
ncbi:MAG: MmcQ/YjbR family DNA-binding protein [Litorimonas sp.]